LQRVEAMGEFAIGSRERGEKRFEIDIGEAGAGELGGKIAAADADATRGECGAGVEDDRVFGLRPPVVAKGMAGAADERGVGGLAKRSQEAEIVVFDVHRFPPGGETHDTRAASFGKDRA
jgi:hypothetical protein